MRQGATMAWALATGGVLASTMAFAAVHAAPAAAGQDARAAPERATQCAATLAVAWPEPGTRIERVAHVAASESGTSPIPAHCELFGIMHERVGVDGQHYAIRFHLRLPDDWNGGFYFQGGGGADGDVGDALGRIGDTPGWTPFPSALARGYAVLSQDSGHDQKLNANPARGGVVAFGFDPQARADYGHGSFAPVTLAAKAIVTAYYRRTIAHSYFVGCSKGGQEGMVLAQQHPDLFDGIVAAAPGFALPRVGVEETYAMSSIASLVRRPGATGVDIADFHRAFSDAQLRRVADAVAAACDALDGLKDGAINDYRACTTARVRPRLEAAVCTPGAAADCLSRAQLDVLYKVMRGAHWADGSQVYASWSWDVGIAAPGWRAWKLGSADGKAPALNIVLSSASLHSVFTVPPVPVRAEPQALFDAQLGFDVQRDGPRIYATGAGFPRSGWQDLSARSPDLSAFATRGGKLIVPHGVSDPAFSVNDTIAWWNAVNQKARGHAADFARVFPVPGMNHCGGGPATDHYDAFAALVDWVEGHKAPASLIGTAGTQTPWPGRRRPICAYPAYARYKGHGSGDDAGSFTCVARARAAS